MPVGYQRTEYPGVFSRPTKRRGEVFDACATVDGRQRWKTGFATPEEALLAKGVLQQILKPGLVARTPEMHGYAGTGTYGVWQHMIERCTKPEHFAYKNYGARGITVCDRWLHSFMAFLEDMGEQPDGKYASGRALYSIERIDNDGNYEPSNCKWATQSEQVKNQRRFKRLDV